MSDYKSERTKKIEKSKVDDDMPAVKKAVRSAFLGLSRASDKVEGVFKKKDDEKKRKRRCKKVACPRKHLNSARFVPAQQSVKLLANAC
jgi:hypothetical protein